MVIVIFCGVKFERYVRSEPDSTKLTYEPLLLRRPNKKKRNPTLSASTLLSAFP